jgi:hypothetical protein
MSVTPIFVLYSTLGCHLCDQAVGLLDELHRQMCDQFLSGPIGGRGALFKIEVLDIATSSALIERYGVRIPVLLCPLKKQELAWPFDMAEAYKFIASVMNSSN